MRVVIQDWNTARDDANYDYMVRKYYMRLYLWKEHMPLP